MNTVLTVIAVCVVVVVTAIATLKEGLEEEA